jgi:transposase
LEELLVSRVGEHGRRELITEEAWTELKEAIKEGEIASIAQAHASLAQRAISYTDSSSVGQLLKRHQLKLKTGRPRHRKADPQEQERFKKTSPRASGEKVSSSPARNR